ncbi:DUF4435 domain-containing protein [Pseudomonas viridiflava]|uniref:DUF4435 domain-containing protein n=1 Tax=Pseudomonas viridiflava TaxID=33069 RepID=UPI000F051E30|nr:DUF4435 domain-containing protein [Pseudomonas viridiflava]
MSGYTSVATYCLVVRLRTKKTILVEGVSDKKLLSHFILKRNYVDNVSADYCIDDASLINDAGLTGVGARDVVKNVYENLNSENFRCLVDREWDGLNAESFEYEPIHYPDHVFVTRGHSIENYWFTPESLIEFMIHTHSAIVREGFLRRVHSHYISILQFSAAYSLACRDLSIIARATDMLSSEDIVLNDETFTASACLDDKISARGRSCNLHEATNMLLSVTRQFERDKLQWVCHGHLGEQAIRACIGSLARSEGYDSASVESIEYGFKVEKFKLDSDHVAQLPEELTTPLNVVLGWVRS